MPETTFAELFASARRSALHLEMRDGYMQSDPVYADWLLGKRIDPDNLPDAYLTWRDIVGEARRRGVDVRRARIVGEPLSKYIRFEHEITDVVNVAAGEQVRWLPRRRASDLALPGNDCWIIDTQTVQFGIFDGDGEAVSHDITTEPAVVKLCADAFEAVWERATPHEEYQPS
ncbi:MAG: hypothetical protein GEV09_27485 [Pseudonocardiaceae bacterium]|nr:hypothetical protein [Pseudonocardiaceae bacterium]